MHTTKLQEQSNYILHEAVIFRSRQRDVWRVRSDGRHRDGDRRRNTLLVVGVV